MHDGLLFRLDLIALGFTRLRLLLLLVFTRIVAPDDAHARYGRRWHDRRNFGHGGYRRKRLEHIQFGFLVVAQKLVQIDQNQ